VPERRLQKHKKRKRRQNLKEHRLEGVQGSKGGNFLNLKGRGTWPTASGQKGGKKGSLKKKGGRRNIPRHTSKKTPPQPPKKKKKNKKKRKSLHLLRKREDSNLFASINDRLRWASNKGKKKARKAFKAEGRAGRKKGGVRQKGKWPEMRLGRSAFFDCTIQNLPALSKM